METFSALLAICAGNSAVPGEFPAQRPVTRSFDVCFDLRLNKRLSKQSWGWWFETLVRPLWRHSNVKAGPVLTHRPRTKWPPFRRWYFQKHFCEWNGWHFDCIYLLCDVHLKKHVTVSVDVLSWHHQCLLFGHHGIVLWQICLTPACWSVLLDCYFT